MDYTILGRTGLRVSVAGLGTGGFSRVGIGQSEAHAVGIIRRALDLGVNLIDTAAVYGTESVVGQALKGVPRASVVVCTKASKPPGDATFSVAKILESLDGSLTRLGLDHVDVFQLHAVPPAAYDFVRNEIAPALLREKAKGKFRFLGITETSPNDHEQMMLRRAAADTPWDTAMFAFNLMDQVARQAVFPLTLKHKVGTLMMFAVRSDADDVRGAEHLRPPGATGRDDTGSRRQRAGAGRTGRARGAAGFPRAFGWRALGDRRGVSLCPA
jgi:L-galactose dehydrogenase